MYRISTLPEEFIQWKDLHVRIETPTLFFLFHSFMTNSLSVGTVTYTCTKSVNQISVLQAQGIYTSHCEDLELICTYVFYRNILKDQLVIGKVYVRSGPIR